MSSQRFSSLFGKLFMTLVAFVTAYSVAGLIILPLVIKSQLHRMAAEMPGGEASVSSLRCNPFAFTLWAKDLSVKSGTGTPLASIGEIFIDLDIPRPPDWTITFSKIELDRPFVHTEIEPDGRLNLDRVAESFQKDESAGEADQEPVRLLIDRLIVAAGRIDFVDRSTPTPFETALDHVDVELISLSTLHEHTGHYTITAQLPDGADLLWGGDVSLNPLAVKGHFSLDKLSASAAWSFLHDGVRPAETTGTLALSGRHTLMYTAGKTDLSLNEMAFRAKDLSIAPPNGVDSLLRLSSLQVEDARLDFAAHEVSLGRVQMAGGRLAASIDETGKLNWLELFSSASQQAAAPQPDAAPPSDSPPETPASAPRNSPPSAPWKLLLPTIKIEDISLLYSDESRSAPVSLAMEKATTQLTGYAEFPGGSKSSGLALTLENLGFSAQNLSLSTPGEQEPLLALNTVQLSGARLDLAGHEASLGEVNLADGKAAVSISKDGTLNWLRLLAPAAASPHATATLPPAGEPAAPNLSPFLPWKVAVPKVNVSGLAVSCRDNSRQTPLDLRIGNAALTLSGTIEQQPGDWQALFNPFAVRLSDTVLNTSTKAKPPLRIAQVDLSAGRFDWLERNVSIGRLGLEGGGFETFVDERGRLNWAVLTEKVSSGPPASTPAALTAQSRSKSSGKPWRYSLDLLELKGFSGSYEDRSRPEPLSLGLEDIALKASGLTHDEQKPVPFEASLRLKEGGEIALDGTVKRKGPELEATLTAEGIPLNPLNPYLARQAKLTLTSGQAGASGPLKIAPRQDGGTDLTFTGGVRVDGLQINESETGSTFLAWKHMDALDVRFELTLGLLKAGEVKIEEPQGKFIIFEDGTVNVKKVLREQSPPSPAQAAPSRKETRPSPPSAESAPFQLRFDRIRIHNGVLDFADLTLTPRFGTRIHGLSGTITGLSNAGDARAKLQLEGRVDEYGFSRIGGTIQPFEPKAFSDVTMTFRNVEMTRLTPYSGKFAGRKINSGKLSADLQYKINGGKLEGDNKFVVEKLVLGEHVESRTAMNLPLDLAVALLKDSKGVINLGIPVTGDLNDPQFDFGQLIGKAFTSFITKIVTAPFRILGALLPSLGDKPLDTVTFEPGSTRLLPPEREKLNQLVTAMKSRPELKIEILGGYDPAADGTALKTTALQSELSRRMEIKAEHEEAPPDLDFSEAATQLSLERLYTQRRSEKALDEFKTQYEKKSGKKVKEVSRLLAFVGRGSQDKAYYEALYKELIELQPLPDAALPELARKRAEAVKEALLEEGRLPVERLSELSPSSSDGYAGKSPAVRLNLSYSAR